MKFKVGDKIRDEIFGVGKVVETNETDFLVQFEKANGVLHNGSMGKNGPYKDNTCYWYSKDTIKLKKIKDYTYEDLKKAPIGTKVTFENEDMFMKYNENIFIDLFRTRKIEWLSNLKDNFEDLGKIIKIEEPAYQTVYEAKQEILDEAEKRYLRGVIRPFRDKVKRITKNASLVINNKAYITIGIENSCEIVFPYFDKDTMYKGMKDNKGYTLEELGL